MDSIVHHLSKDGSSTLFSTQFNQFYHNPNGAISESRHVFFEQSTLIECLSQTSNPISIFEMGFGTGLNFLLLLEYIKVLNIKIPIHFFSVEAIPAGIDAMNTVNYDELLTLDFKKNQLLDFFTDLKIGWNHLLIPQHPQVQLSLYVGRFSEMPIPNSYINFYFHDPFSPEVNPELWTVETFNKLAIFADDKAVLSTYCAASRARAALAKSGWFVAKAPGALGKREMTVASLEKKKISHLKRINESRLIERYDRGDFSDLNQVNDT